MKSLKDFILENKIKYVVVRPMGRAYDMFYDKMGDYMISSNDNKNPDLWIITNDFASDLANLPKYNKFKREITYFEVPEEDIDKFEIDYKNGKFKYDNLKKIDKSNL